MPETKKTKTGAVVVVKCKAGHRRDIGPEGPGPGMWPMCEVCHRPMFPYLVKAIRRPL